MTQNIRIYKRLFQTIPIIVFSISLSAQDTSDSSAMKHLYRPSSERVQDTLAQAAPNPELDSVNQDSINARLIFIEDSIRIRQQFIQDSIIAREIFVRDSIQRRQRMRDSVLFLQAELPPLLDASLKTFSDDIILTTGEINTIGDSMLSDYISILLPFTIDKPYTPWKSIINLSDKPIKFTLDTIQRKITSLQTPSFTCDLIYGKNTYVLRIESKSSITSTKTGRLYKVPIDSVFFDSHGRIAKVKRYFKYHQVTSTYQIGTLLFLHLDQVKQFEYSGDELVKYEQVSFCKRERISDPKKVCKRVICAINRQGNKYLLSRKTDPENNYADGNFTYEFEPGDLLKSISFKNLKNTEEWTTYIEVNEKGYVSRYIYKNKGAVHKTLLVNYNAPGSKNSVETITCIFEDDGVSYYQVNNTTGKSRSRDKLTMEWSPWR